MDGVVKFTKKNKLRFDGRRYLKTVVHVVPAEEVKSVTKKAPAKKTAETKDPIVKKPTVKKVTTAKKVPAKKVTK